MALELVVSLVVSFAWGADGGVTVEQRFPTPKGFTRVALDAGTFGSWLRTLPVLPEGTKALLFDGAEKERQDVVAAVIDIDVGSKDLQQCADGVMRLRAEWLYAAGRANDVSFNDTGKGAPMPFARWAKGERPKAKGNALIWSATAKADDSRSSFRSYLDTVFIWAGTSSLERQLKTRTVDEIWPGDVVIKGGFPGHAVLVLDVAKDEAGHVRVLLAQSYMPAQNLHVLKNESGAWFEPPSALTPYVTPEWTFPAGSLRTW